MCRVPFPLTAESLLTLHRTHVCMLFKNDACTYLETGSLRALTVGTAACALNV